MECQPKLNGNYKPVFFCISSFEEVLLWKVIKYSCQFFYFLFYISFCIIKDFCHKFFFFIRFTQTQALQWPKSATLLCLIVRVIKKLNQGKIIDNLESFFCKICSFTPLQLHSGQHTFSPTKNGMEIQLPPFLSSQRNEKKILPSFHPSPHLHFEINFSAGASATISVLKMTQMVEILISDLVLIVNWYGYPKESAKCIS